MGRQIKMWQADDGKVFYTEFEMLQHEKWKQIGKGFREIYGSSEGCRIYFSDFCEWADENLEWLKSYLEYMDRG